MLVSQGGHLTGAVLVLALLVGNHSSSLTFEIIPRDVGRNWLPIYNLCGS